MPGLVQTSGQGTSDRTMPGAITAGNTLLYLGGQRSNPLFTPTGYTACPDGNTTQFDSVAAFYKLAGAGESTTLLIGTLNQRGIWLELPGGWAPDPDAHIEDIGSSNPPNPGTIVAPPNSYVFAVIGMGATSAGGWDAAAGSINFTPPAGWIELCDGPVFDGHPSVWVGYQYTEDGGSFTADPLCNAGPSSWHGQLFAMVSTTPPPPPDPGGVVDIYDPDDVLIGTLTGAFDIKTKIERNATGYGSFKIRRDDPDANEETIQQGRYVRVTFPQIDPDPIFGFFLEEGDFTLLSPDESGGEDLSFEGRGGLLYWARAMWLAESFAVEWWPSYMADPPSNAIGAIALLAGTYIDYGVLSGSVVSENPFYTGGFSAYYDSIRTFHRSGGRSDITLVHLITSAHSGDWVHSSGTGIKRYPKKSAFTLGNSVLMQNIGNGNVPGQVLYAMWVEVMAADRPIHPMPNLTIDFDDTVDSDGNPWTVTEALRGLTAELGEPYMSTIGKLMDTGAIDVVVDPDLGTHAYNSYGRDLHGALGTDTVRFEKGLNIAGELIREFTDERDRPLGTFAEVLGNVEGAIARVLLPDPGDIAPREISVHGETDDTDALAEMGLAELEVRRLHFDAIGFDVDTPTIGNEAPELGRYLPGPPGSARGNYWIGDFVTLHTGDGEDDFDEAIARIAAITIIVGEAGDLLVAVELGAGFGGIAPGGSSEGMSGGMSGGGGSAGGVPVNAELYQLRSEQGEPNGYPHLGDDGLVPWQELQESWKRSVRLASDADITLADLIDGAAFGGDTVAEGDEVLLKEQAAPEENGIVVVQATDPPIRRSDADTPDELIGAVVLVREGTHAGTAWQVTSVPAVIDTDPITWAQFGGSTLTPEDVMSAGRWEVMMETGVSSPPEPLWTSDGTDWVYGWVED